MVKLETVSNELLHWCQKIHPLESREKEVVGYGIRFTLETASKFFVFLIAGYLTGCVKETVTAFAVFGLIRSCAGGVHMQTNLGCTAGMAVLMGTAVYLSRVATADNWGLLLCWMVSLLLLQKYAPADFTNNMRMSEKRKYKVKRKAMIVTSVLFLVMLVAIKDGMRNVMLAACMAEMLTILPIFQRRKNHEET